MTSQIENMKKVKKNKTICGILAMIVGIWVVFLCVLYNEVDNLIGFLIMMVAMMGWNKLLK